MQTNISELIIAQYYLERGSPSREYVAIKGVFGIDFF